MAFVHFVQVPRENLMLTSVPGKNDFLTALHKHRLVASVKNLTLKAITRRPSEFGTHPVIFHQI